MVPNPRAFAQSFPSLGGFLDREQIEHLLRELVAHETKPGDVLIEEGQPAGSVWFAIEGALAVSLDVQGTATEVGRITPGSVVGEIAFLDGGPASATVTVTAGGTLLRLDRDALERLHASDPRIATSVLRALCQSLAARVRGATLVLEKLRHPNARIEDRRAGFLDAIRTLFGVSRG